MEWRFDNAASDSAHYRSSAFSKDSSIDDPLSYLSSSSSTSSSSLGSANAAVPAPPSRTTQVGNDNDDDTDPRGSRRRSHRPRGCRGGRKNRKKQLGRLEQSPPPSPPRFSSSTTSSSLSSPHRSQVGTTTTTDAGGYYYHHNPNHHPRYQLPRYHHQYPPHGGGFSGNPLSPKENRLGMRGTTGTFGSTSDDKWTWGLADTSTALVNAQYGNGRIEPGWSSSPTASLGATVGGGWGPDENRTAYWGELTLTNCNAAKPPNDDDNNATTMSHSRGFSHQVHEGVRSETKGLGAFGLSVVTSNNEDAVEAMPRDILPPPPSVVAPPDHGLPRLEGPNPYALSGSAKSAVPSRSLHNAESSRAAAAVAESATERLRCERIERQRRMMADGSGSLFATSPRSFLLGGGRSSSAAEGIAW